MPTLVEKYQRIEALVEKCKTGARPATHWVTAHEWTAFAAEVGALETVKPENIKRTPGPSNFQWALVGKNLKVANAGTDSEAVVNAMNWREAPIDFAYQRDRLRIG